MLTGALLHVVLNLEPMPTDHPSTKTVTLIERKEFGVSYWLIKLCCQVTHVGKNKSYGHASF